MSIADAEEWAHEIDRGVEPAGDGYPASYFGPRNVVLTRDGVRMTFLRVSTDEEEAVTLKPRCGRLWTALLSSSFKIDESFTVGAMIDLLDLPPDVARDVYLRTMPYEGDSFGDWVESAREAGYARDTDIEYVEVRPIACEMDGVLTLGFDASGIGFPLERDNEDGYRKGERINYGLCGSSPAMLRDVPLRYNDEFILPVEHAEVEAFLRGPYRAWRKGGEKGPRPEMPAAFRGRRTIRLGEFIGALFMELGSDNYEPEREAGDEDTPTDS